jgi:CheY-like chemotaxis protein
MTPPSTILVIDDDSLALKLMSAVLREAGYTVSTAGSGEEGLRQFRERPFSP